MTDWNENSEAATAFNAQSFPSTTWTGKSAEPHRLYGVGRYGIRAYGQGSVNLSPSFTEVSIGG